MSADDAPVTVLSEDESWSLLSSMSLGRIVTIMGGKPEIFPVNFVTQRRTVLFRTAQGTKLYSAVMGGSVAFEADYHDPPLTYGWSVIIKGRAHVLSANADILDAQEAPLRQWIATLKPLYVRVIASESPAGGSSSAPNRVTKQSSLDDCCASWQRNRHAASAAKCMRSRDFRPSHVFRLRPTGHRPLPGRTHTGPAAQLRHSAIYQKGCRLNRPTEPIHSKKSQKRISDVREVGNIQGWYARA